MKFEVVSKQPEKKFCLSGRCFNAIPPDRAYCDACNISKATVPKEYKLTLSERQLLLLHVIVGSVNVRTPNDNLAECNKIYNGITPFTAEELRFITEFYDTTRVVRG